jgi:hypothetical protein
MLFSLSISVSAAVLLRFVSTIVLRPNISQIMLRTMSLPLAPLLKAVGRGGGCSTSIV